MPGRQSIWRARLALLILVAAGSAGCASHAVRPAVAPRTDQPHVSVITFNVNYALAEDEPTINAVAGAGADADVIFLQETTPAWEAALRPRLSASHPHIEFRHHDGAGGLAVLSRLPVKQFEYLPAVDWFPAARVVLDTGFGPLQVLSVHLRPPISDRGSVVSGYFGTPPVRKWEFETFAAALDPDIPTLVVGDFNENDGGRALHWLRGRGMRSALPQFQPYARTWRWQTSLVTLHGRYDHIVYDPRLEPLSVHVSRTGRSDHLPVVGVFALADAAGAPGRAPYSSSSSSSSSSYFRERYRE
jgi:endonuclease/exonuclease/phosphatase (EEP) superfamily protein YafD